MNTEWGEIIEAHLSLLLLWNHTVPCANLAEKPDDGFGQVLNW